MKYVFPAFLILFMGHIWEADNVHARWSSLDSTTLALIEQGIHQVHVEEYENAIETFEQLTKLHPQLSIGYFGSAAVYQTIMRNYRINTFESQFDSLINLAIQRGEKSTKKSRDDALAYFFLGGAYGFRGLHKVRKRDWLSAFQDGLKGLSDLKRAVAIDPKLYDAYYGLGTFHYWRSARAKIFNILQFVNEGRQRGIDEIWTAIDKGRYSSIEGKYALVAIYYDNKKYQTALSLNQELYELFPRNPACLYMRSRIYERQEKWEEAENTYQQLLKRLLSSEYRSVGYEIECHCGIAYCQYQLGEFEQAITHIDEVLELKNERDPSKEIEGPLENLDEIVSKTERLYEVIKEKDPEILRNKK